MTDEAHRDEVEEPERCVALYGGSFNPPHLGHLVVVSYVLATQPVESVWLMPCYQHAFAKSLAPFADRAEMARRLTEGVIPPGRAFVTDVEARLGGESRTIDTVRYLRKHYPDTRFDLVVGSDIFGERHAWKEFDALESMCRFIVIGRTGFPDPEGHQTSPPLMDVSSSDIRDRVANGQEVGHLIAASVRDLIDTQGLYR